MLKGTLKNKTTGDTLTVYEVSYRGKNGLWANIEGEGIGQRSFKLDEWDFIESTPTADEFVLSLPVGTVFSSSHYRYVKVSATKVYNADHDELVDLAKWVDGWFSREEPITIKED